MKDLRKKNWLALGGGQICNKFVKEYKEFEIEKKITLILDNNKEKYDTQLEIYDQVIDIISIQKFCLSYPVDDFLILITCIDFLSVYRQLQQIEDLKNVECCVYLFVECMTHEFKEKNRYYPKNLRVYEKPIIPKVIHYCWFGGEEIPAQNKKWIASWKKFCPDYEIVEWNESNYDISKNRYMREAYQEKKWGFVPDYARLDIIYQYGGIYLDTDVEIIRNLDELLYQDAYVGIDKSKKISLGLGFGARPGFNLFKKLMDEYDDRSFYNSDGTPSKTAAPALQEPFFNRLGYVNNGEYQIVKGLAIYPEKILSGKCGYTGKVNPTKNTFSIHHYDASWVDKKGKTRVREIHDLFKFFDSCCEGM